MADTILEQQTAKLEQIENDPHSLKLEDLDDANLNNHKEWFQSLIGYYQELKVVLQTDLPNEFSEMSRKNDQFDELLKEY